MTETLNQPIEIESKLDRSVYVKEVFRRSLNRPSLILVMVVAVFMFLHGVIQIVQGDETVDWFFPLWGLLMLIFFPWSVMRRARRNFDQTPALMERHTYIFSESNYRWASDKTDGTAKWDAVTKVVEGQDIVYLYHGNVMATHLNREAFTYEQFKAFKVLITSLDIKAEWR